jgi:hypothetical protein
MQKISLFVIALFSCVLAYGQTFTNVISGSGIPVDRSNVFGILDYNQDGLEDLLLVPGVTSSGSRILKLYKNAGSGSFTDVTTQVAIPEIDSLWWVFVADMNNDGYQDITTIEAGTKIRVFCGSSSGNFSNQTINSGFSMNQVQQPLIIRTADVNKDGKMDIVFTRQTSTANEIVYLKNEFGTGVPSTLNTLLSFPLNQVPNFQFFDYDQDRDLDLFVIPQSSSVPWPGGGYYYHDTKTYQNNNGVYTEVPTISPIKFPGDGFQPYLTDYNQDGKFDIMAGKPDYATNSSLFLPIIRNNGNGNFSDVSSILGFSSGGCYQYPPNEADFDNDGDLDYYNSSWGFGGCDGSLFFRNDNGNFSEQGAALGGRLRTGSNFNGANRVPCANFFDFDNDGDLDFFGSIDDGNPQNAFFIRNNSGSSNKWLKVKLNGCQSGKNGFYSEVMAKSGATKFYRIHQPIPAWFNITVPQSQLIHFGLGTATTIDSLVVKWPSGQTTILTNVAVNQTLTVNESQPTTLTASGALTFCQGGSVTLSTNTTGNTWYKNGTLIANQTGATLVVNSTGSYTVQGTSSAGCVSVSNAIQVAVNPAPAVPVVSANGPLTFCQGGSITLSNTSPGTKQWLKNNTAIPNQTGNSLTVNTAGSYTLRISNTNGCQSTSLASTVVVNPLPVANINSSGATTFCSGGTVTLTASGGGTYLWSNNQTTPTITVSASGSYVVTVTANGCSAKDTQVVVVNPQPVVSLSIPAGNFININQGPWPLNGSPAGGTYSGVGINNGLFSPSASGLGSKQIGYTYTSAAGCTGSKSEKIIVYDTTGIVCTSYDTVSVTVTDTLVINAVLTQVAPPNNRNTIKIYPNPANTHLTIDNGNYGLMQGYKIRVTNSLGQEVFFSPATQQQFYIDLSSWTGMGSYFVHLIDDQGNTIQIKKIILQ